MKRNRNVPKFPRWINGLAILMMIGMVGQSFTAFAGGFKPKQGIGKSARRIGLATRGGCSVSAASPKLTALVPLDNNGLTMTTHPTFYWFMPQNTYEAAQFRLIRVDEAVKTQETIYSTVIDNTKPNQIQSVTLPTASDVMPLEAGKDYRWDITLICDPDEPSGNLLAQGWIRYEAPNVDLSQQLKAATPEQSYDLFASNGYWYESVQYLQHRLQENPDDFQMKQKWQSLLTQEEVQLESLLTPVISGNTVEKAPLIQTP